LRVLKARDDGVQKILETAHRKLEELTKDKNSYKILLQDLIVQGLISMEESDITILCRKQDLELVEDVVPEASAQYQAKTNRTVTVGVEKVVFLPPGRSQTKNEGEICSGGVVLSASNGKIICSNTLDARLSMSFEAQLPLVRTTLFGKSKTRVHFD